MHACFHIDNSLSILTAQSVNHNYIIFHFFAIGCGRFSLLLFALLHLVLFWHLVLFAFCKFLWNEKTENYGCNYNFWHMSIWLFLLLCARSHTQRHSHNGCCAHCVLAYLIVLIPCLISFFLLLPEILLRSIDPIDSYRCWLHYLSSFLSLSKSVCFDL